MKQLSCRTNVTICCTSKQLMGFSDDRLDLASLRKRAGVWHEAASQLERRKTVKRTRAGFNLRPSPTFCAGYSSDPIFGDNVHHYHHHHLNLLPIRGSDRWTWPDTHSGARVFNVATEQISSHVPLRPRGLTKIKLDTGSFGWTRRDSKTGRRAGGEILGRKKKVKTLQPVNAAGQCWAFLKTKQVVAGGWLNNSWMNGKFQIRLVCKESLLQNQARHESPQFGWRRGKK